MSGKSFNHRYIPGLDGIRALSVLAVIAYHFSFGWARGGFLGVDIFFVLSGYLITSTVLPLKGNQLTVSLGQFWIGRFRRLLPAAYVMIMTIFVWVMLFNRDLLNTLRGDAISSVFYSSNWWFIFHEQSYFDSFGSPSPLKNLWSLAIEEQFYLLWPILLIIGLSVFKEQSKLSIFVFIAALSSAVLMGVLYQPGEDPSRIYYGTDTRSFELLIGCWLALIWPMKKLSSKKLSNQNINILNSTSFVSFSIIILCIVFVDEYQAFLYRGGMFLFSINAAILIACVCHPVSYLGKILSWKPLCWLGSRSYGIYLWHYPIMVLGTPLHEIGNPAYWRVCLQLVLILVIAELSYRFIESPIRKQGFRSFYRKNFMFNLSKWRSITLTNKISTLIFPLLLLVFIFGMIGMGGGAQKDSVKNYPTEIKINGEERSTNSKEPVKNLEIAEKDSAKGDNKKDIETIDEQGIVSHQKEKSVSDAIYPEKTYKGILAIGDSLMLDIASSLQEIYPNITIDAKIGRQVRQAIELVPNYAGFNQPDKAVIIQLGTNGYFTDNQIDTLLEAFSNANIYLVNTRVPRSWERNVNDALLKKAEMYDNITLIDWYSAAINHPEYFGPDGVHLVPKGVETLTNLIQQAIKMELEILQS